MALKNPLYDDMRRFTSQGFDKESRDLLGEDCYGDESVESDQFVNCQSFYNSVKNEPDLNEVVGSSLNIYFNSISNYPLLTKEQEQKLFYAMKDGSSEAKTLLICCNLKLVVYVAKRYVGRGLPYLDLIQEGNVQLIKSVDRFDINMGYRFATYAGDCIEGAIIKAIEQQSRLIRLPTRIYTLVYKAKQAEADWFSEFGRKPTNIELATKLNISVDRLMQIKRSDFSMLPLDYRQAAYGRVVSEIIADPNGDNVELMDFDDPNYMAKVMDNLLPPRYADIMRLRFGFEHDCCLTLSEIGRIYGVKKQRVDQIVRKSLNNLRQSEGARRCLKIR